MAPRSSIKKDPRIQRAVDEALANGDTIEEIAERVKGDGISRSAVGRYAREYRPLIEETIRFKAVAKAMRAETEAGGDDLTDLAIQQSEVLALRTLIELNQEGETLNPLAGGRLAGWVRANVSARQTKARLDEEERARLRAEAAEAGAKAAQAAGASDAVIDRIRRDILGMKS